MTARIASRSAGESRGLQMSQIRMMRISSLSFQASCSIVSSNTQASPIRHSRISPPTRNPRPWLEHGEHGGRRAQVDHRLRQTLYGLHRRRRARAALGDFAPLVVEMEGAPPRRLVELAPLVERKVIVVVDVGAEARLVL